MSEDQQCSNCKFWSPYINGKGDKILYACCNRFPPTAQRVPDPRYKDEFPAIYNVVSTSPRTQAHEFCGEHQLAPLEKIEEVKEYLKNDSEESTDH